MEELLDLVSETDEVIGTISRKDAHNNPDLIHREIAIIIFNSKGQTLLQQRSLSKKTNPVIWACAGSGHVGAGENPKETCEREIKEELGIDVSPIFFKKEFERSEKYK